MHGDGVRAARTSATASPRPIGVVAVWGLLVGYVALFLLVVCTRPAGQARLPALLLGDAFWLLSSLVTLAANRRVPRGSWLLAAALAALVWLASTGQSLIDITGVDGPVLTLVAVLACGSALARHPDAMAPFLRDRSGRGIVVTLVLGLAAGVVLGLVNGALFAFVEHQPLAPAITYGRLVTPLSPAIFEEVAMRATPLALAVTLLGGRPRGRTATAGCLGLMTVPHLLPHVADMATQQPLGQTLGVVAVLFLLFAVPFALLQLRRDITSAMVAHGLVDLLRFVLFGGA